VRMCSTRARARLHVSSCASASNDVYCCVVPASEATPAGPASRVDVGSVSVVAWLARVGSCRLRHIYIGEVAGPHVRAHGATRTTYI
jgi:hypothetical protein